MIVDDDYLSIDLVLAVYNHVDRFGTNGIVLAVGMLYNKSTPLEPTQMPLVLNSLMSEAASEAKMLGGIDIYLVYDPMPVKRDEISVVLSSVSNTLDPIWFANGLVNDAAIFNFKMSVGAISALSPDISDDL